MRTLAIIALALLLGACVKDSLHSVDGASEPRFRAGVQTYLNAAGDAFVANDSVGIFMLNANAAMAAPSGQLADNVAYKFQTGGTLAAAGTPILFPAGPVDFVAYAPHREAMSASWRVDLTEDWLWARSDDRGTNAKAVTLTFRHVLAKLTMNLNLDATLTPDPAMQAKVAGLPDGARLDWNTGATFDSTVMGSGFPVAGYATTASFDTTFTTFVVPQAATAGRTATFTIGGRNYVWAIPGALAIEAGKHYVFSLDVKPAALPTPPPHGGEVTISGPDVVTDWGGTGDTPTPLTPTPAP